MGSINNYFNVDIYARNIGKDMLHSTNSFGISYIRLYDFRNTELKTRLFVAPGDKMQILDFEDTHLDLGSLGQ